MTLYNSLLGPGGISSGYPELYNSNAAIPVEPQFIYIFYFININTDGNSPSLIINADTYSDYNNFISSGVLPLKDQIIDVSDSTARVIVNKTLDNTEVSIDITNRDLPSIDDPLYIQGRVEIWSRYLNNNGQIPASRFVKSIVINSYEKSGFVIKGTPINNSGGNPGNRTYNGILQSNGFYKSIFGINLPYINSASLSFLPKANLFYNAVINPYSVPPSGDIVLQPT